MLIILATPVPVQSGKPPCPQGGGSLDSILNFILPAVGACPHTLTLWAKSYGGNTNDILQSAVPTSDGGVIAAGYNQPRPSTGHQFFVLRLDANGNIIWQRTYGGGATSDDFAHSVRQTLDGGFIVAGHSFVPGSTPGNTDFWVLRLDANGGVIWQKKYGGAGGDHNAQVDVTPDGGFFVAGVTASFGAGPNGDFWVLRLDATGNIIWQKTYGGSGTEYAYSMKSTSDGGAVVAGYTNSFGGGGAYIWVLRLDANGNVVWQKTYGGSGDEVAYSVELTPDGFVVAGWTGVSATVSYVEVLRLNANGNVLWQKSYGSGAEYAESVQSTVDGGFIVAGVTASFGAGGDDMWALRLDGNGNVVWQKTYGGTNADRAYSVRVTSNGGFMLAGTTGSFGSGGHDFWVLQLDANGSLASGCSLGTTSTTVVADSALLTSDSLAIFTGSSATVTVTAVTGVNSSAKATVQC